MAKPKGSKRWYGHISIVFLTSRRYSNMAIQTLPSALGVDVDDGKLLDRVAKCICRVAPINGLRSYRCDRDPKLPDWRTGVFG